MRLSDLGVFRWLSKIFFQIHLDLPLTRFHFFHFFGILEECQHQCSPGLACVHQRMDSSTWRASVHQSMDSRQGVHPYINEWTPPPGCALVHQPMDCMARRATPPKIPQGDLHNPKKVSPKSQKSVSKISKKCLQNPKKVSPGPGKMRHRFKSGVQPQRHRMDFWCHFSNTSARPKSRKKCLQNLEKVSPKSRKSVSKISKKCLQNLQKVSPKRLTVGSPLGDVRMHTLEVESIR